MKQCSKCHRILPESEFHECKIKKDGLRNECKACNKEYHKKYRQEYQEEKKIRDRKYYLKNKEKRNQQSREYYQKNKKKILEQQRKKRQNRAQGECGYWAEYNKKYYKTNKRQIKISAKDYYQNNKDQIKKKRRVYYQNNKDKISEYGRTYHKSHKEKICNRVREWRRDNPDKHNKHNRKRKLKKKQLFEDFTLEEWQQKVDATDGICPVCGRSYKEIYPFIPTLDHTPPHQQSKTRI